jgi:hypothetical protein
MVLAEVHDDDDDDDSSIGMSPPLSRRSSVSSAFFDENEFNFLARRRQGLKSPIVKSPSQQEAPPTEEEQDKASEPTKEEISHYQPTSRRPGLIRTVIREIFGFVFVEHWLLVKDVVLCVWRYVKRVGQRIDNCRIATFGLLQALA